MVTVEEIYDLKYRYKLYAKLGYIEYNLKFKHLLDSHIKYINGKYFLKILREGTYFCLHFESSLDNIITVYNNKAIDKEYIIYELSEEQLNILATLIKLTYNFKIEKHPFIKNFKNKIEFDMYVNLITNYLTKKEFINIALSKENSNTLIIQTKNNDDFELFNYHLATKEIWNLHTTHTII